MGRGARPPRLRLSGVPRDSGLSPIGTLKKHLSVLMIVQLRKNARTIITVKHAREGYNAGTNQSDSSCMLRADLAMCTQILYASTDLVDPPECLELEMKVTREAKHRITQRRSMQLD